MCGWLACRPAGSCEPWPGACSVVHIPAVVVLSRSRPHLHVCGGGWAEGRAGPRCQCDQMFEVLLRGDFS